MDCDYEKTNKIVFMKVIFARFFSSLCVYFNPIQSNYSGVSLPFLGRTMKWRGSHIFVFNFQSIQLHNFVLVHSILVNIKSFAAFRCNLILRQHLKINVWHFWYLFSLTREVIKTKSKTKNKKNSEIWMSISMKMEMK